MTHPFSVFRIKREERWQALVALLVFIALNALTIIRYNDTYHLLRKNYHNFFVHTFHVSGFDPLTYSVVSQWEIGYNPYRHPLLAFFMYIPNQINQGLMLLTGMNFVQWVVAIVLIFCAFYSFIFLYRILREDLTLKPRSSAGDSGRTADDYKGMTTTNLPPFDATLLTALFFSFAYIMLVTMVPDHFCLSMCILLLTLYVAGKREKTGRRLKVWQTVVFFLITAGISLNNGLKTFMTAWWINRRHFFSPKFFLPAVILPCLVIWGFARWEYAHFVWPNEHARHLAKQQRMKKVEQQTYTRLAEKAKAEGHYDSTTIQAEVNNIMAHKRAAQEQWAYQHSSERKQGKPFAKGEFMRWTDETTPRLQTIIENVFGEGVQLHRDYLLQDVLATKKPVIVHYRHWWNYAAEGLLLVLFLLGVACAWRQRFFWLVISYAALDWLLHIGLGFGINEVYIMSAHWIYLLPITIGYLLLRLQQQGSHTRPVLLSTVRILLLCLTLYLWAWNGTLLVDYML